MGFAYDTWGGSWGASWGGSWGSGSSPPTSAPTVVPTQPTGGWETHKHPLFAPRIWEVRTKQGVKRFDDAEAALAFSDAQREQEEREARERGLIRVRALGDAFPVYYAGQPVIDYRMQGMSALEVLRSHDARMIKLLEKMIERAVLNMQREEEEILLMLAATA